MVMRTVFLAVPDPSRLVTTRELRDTLPYTFNRKCIYA
jgi:hypothetical protein